MTAEQRQIFDQMPYLEQDDYFDIHGWKKRPEVFPGTEIFAVNNKHKAENIWWTIEDCDQKGIMRRTINAKAENVRFAQMFKEAFRSDRILIPATALYEWQEQSDKTKTKYEIWFNEPVFAFAGIARDCQVKNELRRCGVILTTTPNEVFAEIHNNRQRQAVVIRKFDYEKWLDPETPWSELQRLMEPLPAAETHYAKATEPTPDEPNLPLFA